MEEIARKVFGLARLKTGPTNKWLAALYLDEMPATLDALKKAFRAAMFKNHPRLRRHERRSSGNDGSLRDTETEICVTEKRAFKVHPQLLFDIIQRQAGTLTKALCEGVMNSIDADAKRVAVELAEDHATITDDGHGFRDRQEIELFFETFGQPHKPGDATYGTFRMGRGQMFSFGRNRWRSGKFAMDVDIKGRGLDYDLAEEGEEQDGCSIRIDLYKPLSMLQTREITDELRRFVRYVPVPVTVNGTRINRDPAKEKWDFVDNDAYYKFSPGRLVIYNLGVYVNDHRSHSLGIGGVVVTKKQLRLNFARNDVLADECEVWRRVAKVLRSRADKNIGRKRSALNAEERALLARRLRAGELKGAEAMDAAVFQDCTGRWLSINGLLSAVHNCSGQLTAGPKTAKAENVQKAKLAVALNEDLFDEFFAVDDLDELVDKVIKPNVDWWSYKTIALDDLVPNYSERRDVIQPRDWTPNEEIVMAVCAQLHAPDFSQHRKIIMGDADDAEGWTDGKSYIAIARNFLKGKDVASPATWTAIALLLCHEYAHGDASTSATHVHSPEFYETFHDGTFHEVDVWVADALKYVRPIIAKMSKKANKNTLRWLDNLAAANAASTKFEGTLLAAKAGKSKSKPRKQPSGGYGAILGPRGYSRIESPKGTQVWQNAKTGDRCQIDTRHGAWTLTASGGERRGLMTASLAKVFE